MAKRKVTQDDLRIMMAQVKTAKGPATSSAPPNKKYKLSSRELALLEEQRREDERKRAKDKERKAAALAGVPKPDAVPQKSILKNKSAPLPPIVRPPPAVLSAVRAESPTAATTSASSSTSVHENRPVTVTTSSSVVSNVEKDRPTETTETSKTKSVEESSTALPEGFFDDPIQDAKARNVQYVDAAEEEWDRFQKEMVDEMNVAQEILVEDRIEATIGRQIEEIDDQMRAWTRVAEMEKKKEESVKHGHKHPAESKSASKDESDSDENEFEEFLDWRNKI